MLMLSRFVGECLRIRVKPDGPEIWLHVSSVDCGRVRLGIEAPLTVEVLRKELLGGDRPIATRWGKVPKETT